MFIFCSACGRQVHWDDQYCRHCASPTHHPMAAPMDDKYPCRRCSEWIFCPDASLWATECQLQDDEDAIRADEAELAELDRAWVEGRTDRLENESRRYAAQRGIL